MGDHYGKVWSDSDKQISRLNLSSDFPTNLVILWLEMTSQWRSEAEFDFFLFKTNKVNMGDHFAKV